MALTEVSNIFFCTRLQKPRVLKETGEQQQQQRIINLANANSNSYYFRNLQKVMSKFDLITSLEVLNSMREWNSEYYTIVLIQVEPFLCHLDAGFCPKNIQNIYFVKCKNGLLNSDVYGDILSIVLGNLTYSLLHSLSFLKWCLKTV